MVKQTGFGLAEVVLFISLFMKQFYLRPSGSIQDGDILLFASFVIFYLTKRKDTPLIQPLDKKLFTFICCTYAINGAYFIFLHNTYFIKASIFLTFNLFAIMVFRATINSPLKYKCFFWLCKICLYTQLVVRLGGYGKTIEGRYVSTFNDPNQYGYYVLILFAFMFVLAQCHAVKVDITLVDYVVALYLVSLSASVGMTSTLLLLAAVAVLRRRRKHEAKKRMSPVARAVCVLCVVYAVWNYQRIYDYVERLPVWNRMEHKMDKGRTIAERLDAFCGERGIYGAILNPQYCIWGAGDGSYWRFNMGVEMHCTFIGLLFCYGLIPFSILMKWLGDNIRQLNTPILPAVVVVVLESFTLVNSRQPLFWLFFVVCSIYYYQYYLYQQVGVSADDSQSDDLAPKSAGKLSVHQP